MSVSLVLRQHIAQQARYRCGYCLTQEAVIGMPLEIEHIIPLAQGGLSQEDNLWLACSFCNRYKGSQTTGQDEVTGQLTTLFNPRAQVWQDHFSWEEGGLYVKGETGVGRVTVTLLRLNNPFVVRSRHIWIAWGWHPPEN
jgi:hypothetical protein